MNDHEIYYIIESNNVLGDELIKLKRRQNSVSALIFLTGLLGICAADVLLKSVVSLQKDVNQLKQEADRMKSEE